MTEEDYAPCWNCGKLNKKQMCGYFMCNCKGYKESSVLWYLPSDNPEKIKDKNKLFLDEEENGSNK